jgi:hypothetical protein
MFAIAADRQTPARTEAVPNTSVLEWWTGADDRRCGAQILDIGRGGATLQAEVLPPLGHEVWFQMEAPATSPWVRAEVIGHDRHGLVSLKFDARCPEEVLLAATLGISINFGLSV